MSSLSTFTRMVLSFFHLSPIVVGAVNVVDGLSDIIQRKLAASKVHLYAPRTLVFVCFSTLT